MIWQNVLREILHLTMEYHQVKDLNIARLNPSSLILDDKHKMEKEAIEKIVNLLPSEAQRDEVMSLYLEYENKSTPEAWWVWLLQSLIDFLAE